MKVDFGIYNYIFKENILEHIKSLIEECYKSEYKYKVGEDINKIIIEVWNITPTSITAHIMTEEKGVVWDDMYMWYGNSIERFVENNLKKK